MGDAIPLQHGADQFSLSVNSGKGVPLKTAFVKLEPAGLAVTHGVRHGSFIQVAIQQYLQPDKSARRRARRRVTGLTPTAYCQPPAVAGCRMAREWRRREKNLLARVMSVAI